MAIFSTVSPTAVAVVTKILSAQLSILNVFSQEDEKSIKLEEE